MDNCKPIRKIDMSSQGTIPDFMVVQKVLDGETELFEILLRRYNELLYRTVRSYIDRPSDIDDVMQDTYIKDRNK